MDYNAVLTAISPCRLSSVVYMGDVWEDLSDEDHPSDLTEGPEGVSRSPHRGP